MPSIVGLRKEVEAEYSEFTLSQVVNWSEPGIPLNPLANTVLETDLVEHSKYLDCCKQGCRNKSTEASEYLRILAVSRQMEENMLQKKY